MDFKELFLANNSHLADKWESYLDVYKRIFAPYQHRKFKILEIGVMNGGMLDVMASYFDTATEIVGCDIDPKCGDLVFDDERIRIVVSDIKQAEIEGGFGIIIDDGSHICSDVITTFSKYYPLLIPGGIYVIEDLHTSYWKSFGGGLNTPISSIAFLKRLVDQVNREHWRLKANHLSPIESIYNVTFTDLSTIAGIEFTNSMCVIHKELSNTLGKRVVTGVKEEVTSTGIWKAHNSNTSIANIQADVKDDSQFDPFNLIKMVRYLKSKT